MRINSYFVLYSNCIPVKGVKRSIIYDLTRNHFSFIPNDLFLILTKYSKKNIDYIVKKFGSENKKVIQEYFEFLIAKEYIYLCDKKEKKLFPKLSQSYNSPFLIKNAIIEIAKDSNFDFKEIFDQFDELGNIELQLKFKYLPNLVDLVRILETTLNHRIKYIEIILPYNNKIKNIHLKELISSNLRISLIVFYNCPNMTVLDNYEKSDIFNMECTENDLNRKEYCGSIGMKHNIVEMDFFMESISYNNCLNGKISINSTGQIMNCLFIDNVFGNILTDKLSNVVFTEAFQKMWFIKKDKIDTCKVCEFRYMCSDCRANILDNKNPFSKPQKCQYNPAFPKSLKI